MNLNNIPGPGDEATWPPYSSHPNDPRAPASDDDYIEERIDQRTRALLAIDRCNPFAVENLSEAVGNCDDEAVAEICRHLAANELAAAGTALRNLAVDYWEPIARAIADQQVRAEIANECQRCLGRGCQRCDPEDAP